MFKPTVDIRCDPGVLWEPGTAELDLECSLELLGGPKTVTVGFSGTSKAIEGGTRVLDGVEREVVTLDVHFDLEGVSTAPGTRSWPSPPTMRCWSESTGASTWMGSHRSWRSSTTN
ncbi:MAG: hypothetical protein M5U19_19800 [Microthrixaceae bacterium]|nr:hypothetical protein [Microthrixaceae bacterium]